MEPIKCEACAFTRLVFKKVNNVSKKEVRHIRRKAGSRSTEQSFANDMEKCLFTLILLTMFYDLAKHIHASVTTY